MDRISPRLTKKGLDLLSMANDKSLKPQKTAKDAKSTSSACK